MEVKKQPEESDWAIREADSARSWVPSHTRNQDVDELGGKPMRQLFSRGELGQWERVLGFEVSQGKDAKGRGFSNDAAPKEAGDVFRP